MSNLKFIEFRKALDICKHVYLCNTLLNGVEIQCKSLWISCIMKNGKRVVARIIISTQAPPKRVTRLSDKASEGERVGRDYHLHYYFCLRPVRSWLTERNESSRSSLMIITIGGRSPFHFIFQMNLMSFIYTWIQCLMRNAGGLSSRLSSTASFSPSLCSLLSDPTPATEHASQVNDTPPPGSVFDTTTSSSRIGTIGVTGNFSSLRF